MFRVNIDIEGPEFWLLSEKAINDNLPLEDYIIMAATRYSQEPALRLKTESYEIDWNEFDRLKPDHTVASIARMWNISPSTLRTKVRKRERETNN